MKLDDTNLLQNQTLGRALLVLETFSPEQPEWGIRDLSRKTGMNVSTVYRIVATLESVGYLEQDTSTQRYTLGPKVMKLAGLYKQHNSLVSIADRIFDSYADIFPHNFYFGQLCEFEVIYLSTHEGPGPIRISIDPGGSIQLHTTALGKVLLAFQLDEYIREFIATRELRRFTVRSIIDPAILRQQLLEIREKGYAVNDGEHYDDVGAVAAPVFDNHGSVEFAVSLAYPRHHLMEGRLDINNVIQLTLEIAHEITLRTGGIEPAKFAEKHKLSESLKG